MRTQDRRLTAKRTTRNERVRVVPEDPHGAPYAFARLQPVRLDAVVLSVPAVELCALASAARGSAHTWTHLDPVGPVHCAKAHCHTACGSQ